MWYCVDGEVKHENFNGIKQVDKCQIFTVKQSLTELTFRTLALRPDKELSLQTPASLSFYGGNLTLIKLFDTIFSCFAEKDNRMNRRLHLL